MKKSQRMHTVNTLAERKEQEQAKRFAKSQKHFDHQQKKYTELKQYYREYADASQNQTSQNLDIHRLQETRQFMSKLAKAVAQQAEAVERAEANVVTERQHWLDSRCRAMSLEKLTDRYREQEAKQLNTEEQRQADDLSSQRFVWSARQSTDMA
ncbi:flagellar export protein FliJ [Zhongshania borealis]|jgi:flagellar FliJ protein|uniref:Flagellar FliJ protein n=1 Tax=Zhongshania borealis TaxID=889488 RepID=A0ABP7W715_9GAMM|tara:strand:+ start:336 stop:797 length:462 start_codon:yes stop_codon:yes gene_type:complete